MKYITLADAKKPVKENRFVYPTVYNVFSVDKLHYILMFSDAPPDLSRLHQISNPKTCELDNKCRAGMWTLNARQFFLGSMPKFFYFMGMAKDDAANSVDFLFTQFAWVYEIGFTNFGLIGLPEIPDWVLVMINGTSRLEDLYTSAQFLQQRMGARMQGSLLFTQQSANFTISW